MAASNAEIEARLLIIEGIIAGATNLPQFAIDVADTGITDKTGYWVIGKDVPGINGGGAFLGLSSNADPTLDAHFTEMLVIK